MIKDEIELNEIVKRVNQNKGLFRDRLIEFMDNEMNKDSKLYGFMHFIYPALDPDAKQLKIFKVIEGILLLLWSAYPYKVSQKNFSQVTGVTRESIRNYFNETKSF